MERQSATSLTLSPAGVSLICEFVGPTLTPGDVREMCASSEEHVRHQAKVPLFQFEYDALVALIRKVGAGRKAGTLNASDKGRPGVIFRATGEESSLLKSLNGGDYRTTAHYFTSWRPRGSALERAELAEFLAYMLMFEGLPHTRALNACTSADFTIAEAEQLAKEEADDIEGMKSEVVMTRIISKPAAPEPAGEAAAPAPPPEPPPAPSPAPATLAAPTWQFDKPVPAPPPAPDPAPAAPPVNALKHPLQSKTIIAGFALAIMPDLIGMGNQLIGLGISGHVGEMLRLAGFATVCMGRVGAAAAVSIHAPLRNPDK